MALCHSMDRLARNPELRRRVQVGLTKGEVRNALARAVFINRQGDLRDRSFENQCYLVNGLSLIVAGIMLWNSVYLNAPSPPCGSTASPSKTNPWSTSHP